MSTQAAKQFPSTGLRKLSAREAMQRTAALACTLPVDSLPRCTGQVNVGIFFDGTGNNMKADFMEPSVETRKHSNVVRLFQAHRVDSSAGFFASYIPGVGTKFPEIGDDGEYWGPNRGSAFAARGEHRIIWALIELINAPHRYVFGDARIISPDLAKTISGNVAAVGNPGAHRRLVLHTWQDKLRVALLDKKPKVTQINLSVFGFSRGAAQARAFANWLFEVCEQGDGGWLFAGIPIRLHFLGIFDTVASVGLANLFENEVFSGHQSWADGNMRIHPGVEQCVHFVAGHEVRACFPLDSVRVGSSYPSNAVEIMYPGAHSDVGGGYPPRDLGVSPKQDTFISTIPGQHMYHEALRAGVPLEPWDRLRKDVQDGLTPGQDAITAFNKYVAASQHKSGAVETLHRDHWKQYLSWRFKYRDSYALRLPTSEASPGDRVYMRKTQSDFMLRLRRLRVGLDPEAPNYNPKAAAKLYRDMHKAAGLTLSEDDRQLIEILNLLEPGALRSDIEQLFERYVHDSMAGFMKEPVDEFSYNGLGIGKLRTVFKGED